MKKFTQTILLLIGIFTTLNAKDIKEIKMMCKGGNIESCLDMGLKYYIGEGVE